MWPRLTFLMAALLAGVPMRASAETDSSREVVVLLHGMGRSALSMKRLEWTLARAGYRVVNIGYPSTRFTVEELAARHLEPALRELAQSPPPRVHFVTHSLGGILLRHHLVSHTITNLGRVVMLGPPNQGSELADALKSWRCYRLLVGPAGMQLGTGPHELPRTLGLARFEAGIIAGDRSLNPLFSRCFAGPNDGKVSVANARLEGMKDFLVVHHSHTWLPWRKPVIRQVIAFLQHGRFGRSRPDLRGSRREEAQISLLK